MSRLLLLAASFALASGAQAQTCTTEWAATSGDWSNGGNWSAGLPDENDDACITLPGTYTVTLDISSTVASLTLGTAAGAGTQTLLNTDQWLTLTTPSAILATGVYDWQGGRTSGGSTLTNDGHIAMSGTAIKNIGSNTTIRNQALTTLDGTGDLLFLQSSQFVNASDATFDLQSDADFIRLNTGNAFTNNGTFQKTGGTDASVVSTSGLAFDNNQTVRAQSGTIQFDASGTHTNSTFNASAGADVLFNVGVHTIVGTISGSPEGAVRLANGATLTGGTIDFGGSGFEWQNGRFGTVTNTGLLRLTTAGAKAINTDETLTNTNLVEMTDTGVLQYTQNSQFVNASGATFDLQSDADFGRLNLGNTFVNNGTFLKTGGTDVSIVSTSGLAFDNNQTVRAQSGTIRFDGASTHTNSTFTASAGADVFFSVGVQTIVGTVTGTPEGVVRIADGATLTGDTIDFGGTGFEWQSGNMSAFTNAGLLRLNTAAGTGIAAGATVTNTGLVEVTNTGGLGFFDNSHFVNASGATFDLQTDADFSRLNLGNTFTNHGLFQKTGGSGLSQISQSGLDFTNGPSGVVSAESGTIDVNGVFDHQAGALVQGTGVVDVTGATFTFDGDVGPGASPGLLTWQGAYAPLATSTLRVELGGTTVGTDYDQLAVADAATLAGTLVLSIADGVAPTVGDSYTVLTAGAVSGTFATVTGPVGAAFDVVYSATDVVVTVTAITVAEEADAPAFVTALLAPAPNPTRGVTSLRYAITGAGPVTLTVYDPLGRAVARLVDAETPTGEHTVRLDTRALATGVYVVRMTAPGFAGAQRLTVVQ